MFEGITVWRVHQNPLDWQPCEGTDEILKYKKRIKVNIVLMPAAEV